MKKAVKAHFGEAWVEEARNGFNQMGRNGKRERKSAEVSRKRLFSGQAPNDEISVPGSQTPVGTVLEKGQSQINFPSKNSDCTAASMVACSRLLTAHLLLASPL